MKKLGTITALTLSLEVIECDCGYRMGIDARYLEDNPSAFYEHSVHCHCCGAKMRVREILGLPKLKIHVEVRRTVSAFRTIVVEAYDRADADIEAVDSAGDHDFGSGSDPDYQPTGGNWCKEESDKILNKERES